MRLTELHIEGFRSFQDATWKPGALNVVIGPNGSGKSNLLYLIDFLHASAEGALTQHVLSRGGIHDFLHDGQSQDMRVSITAPFEESRDRRFYRYALGIGSSPGFGDPGVKFEQLIGVSTADGGADRDAAPLLDRNSTEGHFVDFAGNRVAVSPGRGLALGETLLSRFVTQITDELHIARFGRYLANMVSYQNFDTAPRAPARQPVVTSFQSALLPNGENLTSFLHTQWSTNKEFKSRIVDAMTAVFGDDFDEILFPPAGEKFIQLGIRWKGLKRTRLSTDISDGVLRFLFLLCVLNQERGPDLVAIDEPETGLHPGMLAVIAEFATDLADRKQVLFVTHSAEFLSAFPEQESLATSVMTMEGGKSELRQVSVDELRYWLKDYSLGEMFRSGTLEGMA